MSAGILIVEGVSWKKKVFLLYPQEASLLYLGCYSEEGKIWGEGGTPVKAPGLKSLRMGLLRTAELKVKLCSGEHLHSLPTGFFQLCR